MNVTHSARSRESDEQLARAVAARDEKSRAAFFALYEKYSRLLNLFVKTRVPDKHVDDLLQDTWMKAWRSSTSFQGGNYRAWLLAIAGNRVVDFYRSSARNNEEGNVAEEIEKTSKEPMPVEQMIDHEARNIFASCMDELDESAALVVRRRIAGDSYRDICHAYEISENVAHKLLFNAKAQLRKCVEAKLK